MVCDAGVDYSKPGLRRGQVKNLSLSSSLSSPSPLSLLSHLHKQAVSTSFLEAVSYLDLCLFERALQVGI